MTHGITGLYALYREAIWVTFYVMVFLKLSARWSDSPIRFGFYPFMFLVFFRMKPIHQLYALVGVLPYAEAQIMPRQVFGISGVNPVNIFFLTVLLRTFLKSGGYWL